jgi:hypothetical protein
MDPGLGRVVVEQKFSRLANKPAGWAGSAHRPMTPPLRQAPDQPVPSTILNDGADRAARWVSHRLTHCGCVAKLRSRVHPPASGPGTWNQLGRDRLRQSRHRGDILDGEQASAIGTTVVADADPPMDQFLAHSLWT